MSTGLNINELVEENQRLNQDGQGFLDNFVKMPDGNGVVVVRLLPPAAAGKFGEKKSPFYQATRVHRLNNRSYHCTKELSNGKWVGECPICRYYNWLWQESDKKAPDEAASMQANARAIKPIERYYYNTLVRQIVNPNTQEVEKNVGPKILSIGKTLHKMIIRAIVGDKQLDEKPLGDVTDPIKGRDFKIIKTMRQSGKESYPNYSDSKFLDPGPLGEEDRVETWLDEMHNLQSLRTVLEQDELKKQLKIHLGLIPDEGITNDFDPTEFQKPAENAEATVTVTKVEETTTTATEAEEVVEGGDTTEPLPDDDFLAELRDIS